MPLASLGGLVALGIVFASMLVVGGDVFGVLKLCLVCVRSVLSGPSFVGGVDAGVIQARKY